MVLLFLEVQCTYTEKTTKRLETDVLVWAECFCEPLTILILLDNNNINIQFYP